MVVKNTLEESVIWVYKHAEAYARLGISPSKGVQLYGPPGSGRALLVKAVTTESETNFMVVSIPDLIKGEGGKERLPRYSRWRRVAVLHCLFG
ncbi:MAG: hypothetical protein J3Q66DRAFT_340287 [Benniella sp.]|nr:MAG: hypothetical protein J3Q66DRAFT_340287 [Benniella sp.]